MTHRSIPTELVSGYTLDGKIPILDKWYDDRDKCSPDDWTHTYVTDFVNRFTSQNIKNNQHGDEPYYQVSSWILRAIETYRIFRKKVAVIGSLTPWMEAILLNHENIVTTVEYNVPVVDYPNLHAISYAEFAASDDMYDAILTFSTVEHSGLGRYGDALDPEGDLKTMAEIRRHLMDAGLLVWGAPVGHDVVAWNAHRIYGRIRLPMIFSGFVELEWIGGSREELLNQPLEDNSLNPVVILRKKNE